MKGSYRWLRELTGIDASASEMADALTRVGNEVEEIEAVGGGLEHVVVAEVRSWERVEGKDKLRLVTVNDGEGERQVICGAPNVPDAGGRVLLAKPGAVLPGDFAIAERKVGGVVSSGMLCSETELRVGEDTAGILVLGESDPGVPGQLASEALGLEDWILEIGLTPNRPDCLGHIGLARDLAAAFRVRFAMPDPGSPKRLLAAAPAAVGAMELAVAEAGAQGIDVVAPNADYPTAIGVTLEDTTRCPRYAAAVMHGVTVKRSPFWLRYRLHNLGVRPIDNVVDVTNLIVHELGHPTHAFDLRKLRGHEIRVRTAKAGETMATLDDVERTFTDDDLLICDGEGPVAVAGVMGGANSEIEKDTEAVVLEVAYFDPRSVRRTSRRLGLHTDASHRFERGVDPNGVPYGVRRACALFGDLAGAAAMPVARDEYPTPIAPASIDLDMAYVSGLLGYEVSDDASRRALVAVGCTLGEETDGRVTVSAPTHRPDLTRPEDLVEEVARLEGYDKVPTQLPPLRPSGRGYAPRLALGRRLRMASLGAGLLEALNFTFVSEADHARARVDGANVVRLANPLSEERSVMRTSLLPGLLDDLRRSRRHQVSAVRLFELGPVFAPGPEQLPVERAIWAAILAGPRQSWVKDDDGLDFYDGKGAVASVLESVFGLALDAALDDALEADAPFLHPRRRARLSAAGVTVGVLGEVHPAVADDWDLDVRPVYAELDVAALEAAAEARGVPQAEELPRFPAVQRDLALVVEESRTAGEAVAAIRDAGKALVEGVELFDVYRGEPVPGGKKSLAFRLVYRDREATLTDKKVDKAHGKVVKAVEKALGAEVRK